MHETDKVMDAIVLTLEAAQPLRKKSAPSPADASARLPHPDEASPRLPLPMKGRE